MQFTSLHGDDWWLLNTEREIRVPLTVPGYALEALQKNGNIDDPLYRMNESEYEWIAKSEWIFVKEFILPSSEEKYVDLVMDGIDTCAIITLNEQELPIKLENAHREHRISVKDQLKPGMNRIQIRFLSAVAEAETRAKSYPYTVPCVSQGKFFHYNFVRKAACDWGWDWGPGFCPCGIYRFIEIHAYSFPYLRDFHVCQDYSASKLHLDLKAKMQIPPGEHQVHITFSIPQLNISTKLDEKVTGPGTHIMKATHIPVETDYKKWWPYDYGTPNLYLAQVEHIYSKGSQPNLMAKNIGLRKVELVTDPLPGDKGETFYFKLNGIPIFAKGANVIPMSIIRTKSTQADIVQLVQDCKHANMNMLRLWGGGIYESDELYKNCDEMGLMVWQDAMFACGAYPRDAAFLNEVEQEIEYQVLRMGSHPSIVVWGGNNENENSLDWFPESRTNKELYIVDMCKLALDTVMEAFKKVDPYLPFVDTSPSNGLVSSNPYVKRFGRVNDEHYGDVHFYNHTANALDHKTYPDARFVSEFGFQSYPSFDVLSTVSRLEDWSNSSEWSKFRQRHPDGNEELSNQLVRHFADPMKTKTESKGGSTQSLPDFKQFIYLTQLQQALCYETAICYWRTLKCDPTIMTGGVLYWQLNDVWQGPSWSSINYGGQWKLLHYMAAKFFAPLLVTARVDKSRNSLEVYLVNDKRVDLQVTTEAKILRVTPTSSDRLVEDEKTLTKSTTRVRAGRVLGAMDFSLDKFFEKFESFNQKNSIIHVTSIAYPLSTNSTVDESAEGAFLTSESVVMLSPWKDMLFDDPQIQSTDFLQIDDKTVKFTLTSKSIMPHVGLESSLPGTFSDNVLLLQPSKNKEITFTGRKSIDAVKLRESLTVYTPVEPYQEDWTIL